MKSLKYISEKNILNMFTISIFTLMPFLKILSLYLEKFNIIRNYDSINLSIGLYISIPFLIYIYISNIKKTKRKLDFVDYIFYILIISGLISTTFSLDVNISLFGKTIRHQGFLSYLCYYLLFINWKIYGTKEDIKKISKILILIGIFNSIYGLLQVYVDLPIIIKYGEGAHMATGLCGNPNFLGSLIVTVLSIITINFFTEKKISVKQILLLILMFVSLINCQSTGPFLAFLILFIFFIVYLSIKKIIYFKKLMFAIVIMVITYVGITNINISKYGIEKCEICNFVNKVNSQIKDNNQYKYENNKKKEHKNIIPILSINNSIDENISIVNEYTIMTGRIETWNKTLEIVSDNVFTGVGFDNYFLARYSEIDFNKVIFIFDKYTNVLESNQHYIVDNPHNIYLNILVSTGILGFIPYMLLIILTFIKGLKLKDNFGLFAGFIAYSIQGFGNIDVIQVVPIYYVIIGLILSIKE